MSIDKNFNIVLCGFMGCGKTTVGRQLAALTGRKFLDTDAYIEKKAHLTVSEIFSKYGEAYFRELEKNYVAEVAQKNNCIIATGGGTVLDENNVLVLKRNGKMFFLDVPFEMAFSRISPCTNRPLAQNFNKTELKNLFVARREIYLACADIVIDARQTCEMICSNILGVLSAQISS